MNLLFFTPVNCFSNIARFSQIINQILRQHGHVITIISTEKNKVKRKDTLDFGTRIMPWHDTFALNNLLHQADACVYQISDHCDDHYGALYRLHSVPGLVCFHDLELTNLWSGWTQQHPSDAQALQQAWGESAYKDIFSITEWICSMAHGVITHRTSDTEKLLNVTSGSFCAVNMAQNTSNLDSTQLLPYTQTLLQAVEKMLEVQPVLHALTDFYNILHSWSASSELIQHTSLVDPLKIFQTKGLITP